MVLLPPSVTTPHDIQHMHRHPLVNKWVRQHSTDTVCPEGHQPHTTNKAMTQLCSINGQHCWSKVSTVYTPDYKNHWRPNGYGWVQRRHSEAGRDHRRVCTLLGKQLRQFIAMPLIDISPGSHRCGSVSENHTGFWPLEDPCLRISSKCALWLYPHPPSQLQLCDCHTDWGLQLKAHLPSQLSTMWMSHWLGLQLKAQAVS